MKPKSTLRSFLLLVGSSLLIISYSHAADGTWTGTTGAWSDTTDPGGVWSGGIVADGADFTANFTGVDINAGKTINLDDIGRTIGNITFTDSTTASNDLTISGANILTLDRTDATAPTIDVTNRTLTISSEIAGTDGFTKTGAGTLVLSRASAANTYSGTTTLSAGILQGNTGASVSLTPGNPFGTSALQLNGGALQLRSSGASTATAETIQWNNNVTVGGNVTINVERAGGSGSNKIHQLGTLSIGAFTLTAEDASSAQHDLKFGATTLTGDAVFNVKNNGGGTTFMNLTLGAVGDGGSGYSLTKSGAGTLTLDANSNSTFSGGFKISGGVVQVDSTTHANAFGASTNVITFTGNATIYNTNLTCTIGQAVAVNNGVIATFQGANQENTIVNGVVSGTGEVRVSSLSNTMSASFANTANTHTGTLWVGGTGGNGLNFTANSLADSSTGTLKVGSGGQTVNFTLGASTSAPVTLTNRVVELASTTGAISLNNDATLAANAFTITPNLAFTTASSGNKTLTLGGSNTGANAFNGSIGNNGSSTTAITKAGGGNWTLTNTANSYTGATTITGGTLQVSTLADGGGNSNIGASTNAAGSLILNGGTLRYTGAAVDTDRLFSLQASSTINASGTGALNFENTGAMGFNGGTAAKTLTLTGTNTGNNTLAAVIGNNTGATAITKTGIGTWVLSAINTNTGNTSISGGGKLILDYGTNDDNKIAGVLNLGGGEITLKGGSFLDTVTSTTIAAGAHTSITRDGGSAKIAFGAITKGQSNGGTMSLSEDNLATTTTPVVNGILGGGITVGSNWAKVDGSGNIIALTAGDYTALPTGATTTTVNYQLTGSQTRAAGASVNSLRISGNADNQVLTITSGDLKPSLVSIGALGNSGGILYAGGGNNNYTITGAGNVAAQNNNQELIINTFQGTLTLDMAVVLNGALMTKTGAGTLVLTKAGTYTFGTNVHQGTLLANNTTGSATGTGNVTVNNGAALGGTGTVGGSTTIASGGGLTFDLTTASGSHDKLELAATKTLAFSGASTLTITSSGGTPGIGTYTLLTAPGGITGSLPTVILPGGWTGTASFAGNDLVLNVTSVGSGGPGPLDHFAISAISSPQTVGTPITGITLTAQDASNATVTSFTGTVTFGGTGGFTGTSASFTAGVLSGVSVTPTNAGSNLTFTVDDGASHTGSTTITTIQTQYQAWAGGALFDADANGDGVKNGMAFLLGAASPTSAVTLPTVTESGGALTMTFNCLPVAARGSATLKVEHSTNLAAWTATTAVVPDATNAIPDNNVTFVVGAGPAGPPALNNVTATIGSAAAASGKLFGRLNAQQ